MSKLGAKKLLLGAALALSGTSAEAKPNKYAEAVLRGHCAQVAEAARKQMQQIIYSLDFVPGNYASFVSGDAAENAHRACLEKMGVLEPQVKDGKK